MITVQCLEYMYDDVDVCHKCAKSSLPVLEVIGPAWKGNCNEKYCIISHLTPFEIEQYNGEKHCKICNCKLWVIYCDVDNKCPCELHKLTVTREEHPAYKNIYISKYGDFYFKLHKDSFSD